MDQGLSERSLAAWEAFAQSVGEDGGRPLDRDLLIRFLIGVHQRGEELTAHDLKLLADQLEVEPELARQVVAFIEPALALLQAYDRIGEDDDDLDMGPGVLVL